MHHEEQHLPFKQMGTITIFSLEYQYLATFFGPFCWQDSCSGLNSGTDCVAVLEDIFLELFSNTEHLLGWQDSEVNHPAVVLTNHSHSFFAWCALFKMAIFPFLQLFVPNDSAFA